MSTVNEFLGCPTGCSTTVQRPAIPVDQLCTSYRQKKTQVSDLFIRYTGAPDPFTNFDTTPTYTASSIDNTSADNTKCHWLAGKGGIDRPEKQVAIYPKGKKRVTERTYTLAFEIMNLSDEQYEHLRKIQCGDTAFTFYYADVEDYLFGKQGGIVPESVDVDFPKGAGDTDKASAILTLTWIADGDPLRKINPYN